MSDAILQASCSSRPRLWQRNPDPGSLDERGGGDRPSTDDNLSGVRDITPAGWQRRGCHAGEVHGGQNGVYNFSVRDYCGNVLTYPVEVRNIDQLAPAADYEVIPGDWTNKPVTIRVTATDPEPEGRLFAQRRQVHHDAGRHGGWKAVPRISVADANGKYDFIITDNGGNTFTLAYRGEQY